MLKTRRFAPLAFVLGLVMVAAACVPPPAGPTNLSPLAIFTTSVSTGNAPMTVTFDATSSSDPDGSVVAYNWDFGDFTTDSGTVVTKTFTTSGSFEVKLTVTDNQGAKSSSTTVITVTGPPAAPTGLTKTGSGCCNTYGDFSWNAVPGASSYQIEMTHVLGCVTNHSATFPGSATSGRVQAIGLCLGSKYDVSIRAQANGLWGDWSPSIRITL